MPNLTEQQKLAVESIDQNVLVSAGAGSGKTMVLVERFLEVLKSNPDSGIHDIIAVTFTRKAAEEMRSRLKSRLRQIVDQQGDDRKRWSKLLADADHARIGTIHSLCESILRTFPAEANVDPQFEVLDDLTRAQLLMTSVEDALQAVLTEPSGEDDLLLEFPVEMLTDWVLRQLGSMPQYKESRRNVGNTLEEMQAHAESILSSVQRAALETFSESAPLVAAIHFAENNPWHDADSPLELKRREMLRLYHQALEQLEEPAVAAASVIELSNAPNIGTAGGPKGKPLRDALAILKKSSKDFATGCPAALTEADNTAFRMLLSLLKLIDNAAEVYETAKSELQRLDYNDLICKTHELVTAAESPVRKHFAERVRAILVDEFQDTNTTQAELISALCGPECRLFLIGDDKQSIYKFQGADVSTFNNWKKKIGSQAHSLSGAGLLLELNQSFRSHPSIVGFVNLFFEHHFKASAVLPYTAMYQALNPARLDNIEPGQVEVILYDAIDGEQKRESEKARAMESRAIATWILDHVKKGTEIFDKEEGCQRAISYGDFAVLVQTNADFAQIESALSEKMVPYVTFAGSGFLHRQEVHDVENLLRWLSRPNDSHALMAVLRAPFFGMNDAVLHKVFGSARSGLWEQVMNASKNEELAVLAPAVAIMKQLLVDAQTLPLSDLVRSIIANTAYDVVCLALPNGKQKSRNAWKLATFASQYNHMSLSEFIETLNAMRDLGVSSQTDAPLSADDSVKLMTIHKSKGLEFPAVVLPVLGRKIHQMPAKLMVHKDFGIALDTTRSSDEEKPSFYKAAAYLNSRMEAEEKKRLLYVAMTRARDFLGLFVERHTTSHESFRHWLKDVLKFDCDDQRTNVVEGTHYKVRHLDNDSLQDWESESSTLASKIITREELLQLGSEMGFDLLTPLDFPAPAATSTRERPDTLRVTNAITDHNNASLVGTVFHAAMQLAVNSTERLTDERLHNLVNADEFSIYDRKLAVKVFDRVRNMVNAFYDSKLRELLATAQRVYAEVNYTIVNGGQSEDKRPDLIFQTSNGNWHIIDFKTDEVSDEQVAHKVNEHSAQVLEYVKDFENITGNQSTGWLYLAHIGRLEQVDSPGFVVAKTGQLRLF